LAIVVASAAPVTVWADSTVEAQASQLYQEIMSPFCPGRSLNDCPSGKAHELKARILAELQAGKPREQVLDEVFKEFGEQYRAVPRYEGFGRVAWWAPVAFLLMGLSLAIFVVTKRNRSVAGAITPEGAPLSDDLQRRIEDELRHLE